MMDAIILAAGYATRLYPLTLNKAKPLLPVGDRPIIDYLVMDLEKIGELSTIYVVTNEKFYNDFLKWAKDYSSSKKIVILNDGTTDDSNKKGAIGDIDFVIDTAGIKDDLLVVAGDNLFNFPLEGFAWFLMDKGLCVGIHKMKESEDLSRYGIVEIDDNGRIINFEEKPTHPKTNLVAACLYGFPSEKLGLIKEYIKEGLNMDQPGNYLQWLVKREPVYAYIFEAEWHDIGTKEAYNRIKDSFKKG